MTRRLSHFVNICADPALVFECCRDVTCWAQFMPAVKAAHFTECGERSDVVSITAEANDKIWTWQSKRTIDIDAQKICFERLDPQPPLAFIKGSWQIFHEGLRSSRLLLNHEYGVTSDPAFEDFLEKSIKSNASRDLNAIKSFVETKQHI